MKRHDIALAHALLFQLDPQLLRSLPELGIRQALPMRRLDGSALRIRLDDASEVPDKRAAGIKAAHSL